MVARASKKAAKAVQEAARLFSRAISLRNTIRWTGFDPSKPLQTSFGLEKPTFISLAPSVEAYTCAALPSTQSSAGRETAVIACNEEAAAATSSGLPRQAASVKSELAADRRSGADD
jgi:hypothetical protein